MRRWYDNMMTWWEDDMIDDMMTRSFADNWPYGIFLSYDYVPKFGSEDGLVIYKITKLGQTLWPAQGADILYCVLVWISTGQSWELRSVNMRRKLIRRGETSTARLSQLLISSDCLGRWDTSTPHTSLILDTTSTPHTSLILNITSTPHASLIASSP